MPTATATEIAFMQRIGVDTSDLVASDSTLDLDKLAQLVEMHDTAVASLRDPCVEAVIGSLKAKQRQIEEQKAKTKASMATTSSAAQEGRLFLVDHKFIQRIGYLSACNVAIQQRWIDGGTAIGYRIFCEKCREGSLIDVTEYFSKDKVSDLVARVEEFCTRHSHRELEPASNRSAAPERVLVVPVVSGRRFREE